MSPLPVTVIALVFRGFRPPGTARGANGVNHHLSDIPPRGQDIVIKLCRFQDLAKCSISLAYCEIAEIDLIRLGLGSDAVAGRAA
jgi:hypothetical protein